MAPHIVDYTPEQFNAIHAWRDPEIVHYLVPATAGAGKSTVLLAIINDRIEHANVKPERIIALTYTRTGARRLRNALTHSILYTETFHSLAQKVLRTMKMIDMERTLMHPDDILMQFLELLRSDGVIAKKIKNSIEYILVDEMQDNNALYIEILKQFIGYAKICACGDDGQAIMGFQGSSITHIRQFSQTFTPCRVFHLSVNFRCTTPIVNLANAVMMNGRVDEYLDKPLAQSYEMYEWSRDSVPMHKRISRSGKPRLLNCNQLDEAIKRTLDDIKFRLTHDRTGTVKLEDFCIQARANYVLDRCCELAQQMGISIVKLSQKDKYSTLDERELVNAALAEADTEDNDDEEETSSPNDEEETSSPNDVATVNKPTYHDRFVKGHALATTVFGAKGEEWKYVYLIMLDNKYFPSHMTPDLDEERRILNVAITRAREMLVVWNNLHNTSIFIQELMDTGMLHQLMHCQVKTFPSPHFNRSTIPRLPANDELPIIPLQEAHKEALFMQIDRWIGELNGPAYSRVRREFTPCPLETHLRITSTPILYMIPDRAEHIRMIQSFGQPPEQKQNDVEELEEALACDDRGDEMQNSENGDYDNNNNDNDDDDDDDDDDDHSQPRSIISTSSFDENDDNFSRYGGDSDDDPADVEHEHEENTLDVDRHSYEHTTYVVENDLEQVFERFLDCALHRNMQELKLMDNKVKHELEKALQEAKTVSDALEQEEKRHEQEQSIVDNNDEATNDTDEENASGDDSDSDESMISSQALEVTESDVEQEMEEYVDGAICGGETEEADEDDDEEIEDDQSTKLYTYMPAVYGRHDMSKEANSIVTRRRLGMLDMHYDQYCDTRYRWEEILESIYWTSAMQELRSGRLLAIKSKIDDDILMEYKGLLAEIATTMHFLIFGIKSSPYSGYTHQDWEYLGFDHIQETKVPRPYIIVGNRLIMINNSCSEHGLKLESLTRAQCYVALENVLNGRHIDTLQIYHSFARRIVRLDCGEDIWPIEQQQALLLFLQKCRKHDYQDLFSSTTPAAVIV